MHRMCTKSTYHESRWPIPTAMLAHGLPCARQAPYSSHSMIGTRAICRGCWMRGGEVTLLDDVGMVESFAAMILWHCTLSTGTPRAAKPLKQSKSVPDIRNLDRPPITPVARGAMIMLKRVGERRPPWSKGSRCSRFCGMESEHMSFAASRGAHAAAAGMASLQQRSAVVLRPCDIRYFTNSQELRILRWRGRT